MVFYGRLTLNFYFKLFVSFYAVLKPHKLKHNIKKRGLHLFLNSCFLKGYNGYFRDPKGASWFSALEGADCPMMIFETGKGHPELAFVIELQCKFLFQSGFDLDNEQCLRPGQSVVTQRNSFLDYLYSFHLEAWSSGELPGVMLKSQNTA